MKVIFLRCIYHTVFDLIPHVWWFSPGDIDYHFPSPFYLSSETHDGQDVGVWARGPRAHLLVGNYEQTVIAHVMAYALGVGPAAEAFNSTTNSTTTSASDRPFPLVALWTVTLLVATVFVRSL